MAETAATESRNTAPQQRRGWADGSLAARLVAGDKRALARAISLVENRDPEPATELVAELFPRTGERADRRPDGSARRRQEHSDRRASSSSCARRDREVGVLSIDPSSPFTQGAVLGDRIRLSEHFLDPGVFIRSMATRGSLGGLAEAALQAALLMDAAGKDDVLLETVGVGQGEIDIIDHADTVVLALMPGSGDSIQALKAGVMEIPDVIVRQQGRPPARRHDDPRGQVGARPRPEPRLAGARCCARRRRRGRGSTSSSPRSTRTASRSRAPGRLPSAARAISAPRCSGSRPARMRRELETQGLQADPEWAALLERVVNREIDPATAARELLEKELDG